MLHHLHATGFAAVLRRDSREPRGADYLAKSEILRSMFAARKSVFVDLLRWEVPVHAGRYEMDQFDTIHATYLIHTDQQGAHRASARLLPTTRPHILDSFYAELCDEPPPRGEDIFEITRFCLDRTLGAARRRMARDRLVHALVEHALRQGIHTYTAIAEAAWREQIMAFGWRSKPLGGPRRIGAGALGALRIEIEADTPMRLIRAGIGAPGNDPGCERNRIRPCDPDLAGAGPAT